MPITLVLTDAAHKYGQDNYAGRTNPGEVTSWGNFVRTEYSWGGGNLDIGVAGTTTQYWSNGFEWSLTLTLTSATTFTLSNISLSHGGELLWSVAGPLDVDAASALGDMADASVLFSNDTITGNSYDNVLEGWGGSDKINGGGGTDTVVFSGFKSQYSYSKSGDTITVSGPDGTDTLTSVERLEFSDLRVAFDTSGVAGQAYRLYQAAFDRTPDSGGLGYWINAMDHGASLTAVSAGFIASAEFQSKYGTLDNSHFATQLYQNILHRAPDAGGLAYWTDILDRAAATRAGVLAGFSESTENQANVVGVISGGIVHQTVY